jgi:hypothetical protein
MAAVAPPPFDLAVLLERLRRVGLRTDVRQYLAAHEVLLGFAAQGRALEDDPQALASHLGPIFCGSPEEQQLFRNELFAWRRAAIEPVVVKKGGKRKKRGTLAASLAALIVIAGVAWWLWPPTQKPVVEPTPIPAPAPEAPAAQPTVESPVQVSESTLIASGDIPTPREKEVFVPWTLIVGGGVGAAVLAFIGLWVLQRTRREAVLKRMSLPEGAHHIGLAPPPSTAADLRQQVLRRISTGLRRGRAESAVELSVTATVDATARAGGFILPTFAPRISTPEYLVLIDRRGSDDHSARIVYRWIEQLSDQGVVAECYEFDTDPRVCREYGATHAFQLPALLARHHRATLFFCAESEVCINPLTNRPQQWLQFFNALPNRVLLTMTPRYLWSGSERVLIDAGFVVLPATPAGLQSAASMDREWRQPMLAAAKYAREFPTLIAQDPHRWLDRNAPPDELVSRVLRELNAYLGPDGYAWLCACAVYPQISWEITLTLLGCLVPAAKELEVRRALDEQLPSLARLPWFRYGYMPDWLRRLLIANLAPEREAAVRGKLQALVCELMAKRKAGTAADGTQDEGAGLKIAFQPRAIDVARAMPSASPLQDAVFMDFISGAAPDPLSLSLSPLPQSGGPRRRRIPEILRGRWRAIATRRPLLARSVACVLVASVVAASLFGLLRQTKLETVASQDETWLLTPKSAIATSRRHAALAPNGEFLVFYDESISGVLVWDLQRNVPLRTLATESPVLAVAVSSASDRFAALCRDGSVYLWNTSGDTLQVGPTEPVEIDTAFSPVLAFSADGLRLAFTSREEVTLMLFGAVGDETYPIPEASGLAFRRQDSLLAVGRREDVALWDVVTSRKQVGTVRTREQFSSSIAPSFSPDGRYLAMATDFKLSQRGSTRIELWDMRLQAFSDHAIDTGWQGAGVLAWSPGGKLLAYGLGDQVGIYNLQTRQQQLIDAPRAEGQDRLITVHFARSEQSPDVTHYEVRSRAVSETPNSNAVPEPIDTRQTPPPAETTPTPPPATNVTPAPDPTKALNDESARLNSTLTPAAQRRALDLIDIGRKSGLTLVVVAARTTEEMNDSKSAGRERQAEVLSAHESGRAFDVGVVVDGKVSFSPEYLERVGKLASVVGVTWGGAPPNYDYRHFEVPAPAAPAAQTAAQIAEPANSVAQTAAPANVSDNAPASAPASAPANVSANLSINASASVSASVSLNAPAETAPPSDLAVQSAAPPAATSSPNAPSTPLYSSDLEKTQFVMPADAERPTDGYRFTLRTKAGESAGSVDLLLSPAGDAPEPGVTRSLTIQVRMRPSSSRQTPEDPSLSAQHSFDAGEFNGKESSRTITAGRLRFTLRLSGTTRTRTIDGKPFFVTDTVQIFVQVRDAGATSASVSVAAPDRG